MNRDNFINNYLKPSVDGLDRSFTHPLPDIPGLKKSGEFIVQGKLDDTFSTNIITKYESESSGVRLVEVYKNTQEQAKGIFIRLVGTLAVVKKGYPFLFLDAAVLNVDMRTAQREDLSTRVAIHLPQAESSKRNIFIDCLNQQADEAGLSYGTLEVESMPDFWGPLWHVKSDGADLDLISKLRVFAWASYEKYCSRAEEKTDFDYTPVQQQMVFINSKTEHHLFKKMGLSVPIEAQAAFFSVLVSGGW
jgi:hypothetical protein